MNKHKKRQWLAERIFAADKVKKKVKGKCEKGPVKHEEKKQ